MEVVYLNDITGTIGQWLDMGFVDDVPTEVILLLQDAYTLAVEEYENPLK